MRAHLRQAKPLSSLMEGIFGAFAVGEVEHDAKETNRRARTIVEKPAERREPANLTIVGPYDPVFQTVEGAGRLSPLDRLRDTGEILRVNTRAPHLAGHRAGIRIVSQQRVELSIPD